MSLFRRKDVSALQAELAQSLRATLTLTWGEHTIDLTPPWRRLPTNFPPWEAV